jgi:peptidyl-dipeptidase Dcp
MGRVLDADAFRILSRKGIFNKADKFKDNILSREELNTHDSYKRFRGHEPSPDALLKRAGLI